MNGKCGVTNAENDKSHDKHDNGNANHHNDNYDCANVHITICKIWISVPNRKSHVKRFNYLCVDD